MAGTRKPASRSFLEAARAASLSPMRWGTMGEGASKIERPTLKVEIFFLSFALMAWPSSVWRRLRAAREAAATGVDVPATVEAAVAAAAVAAAVAAA